MSLQSSILSLIPQQPPFVMIDEVLDARGAGDAKDAEGAVTRSAFTIPAEHVFVSKGYFLEAGLIENIAQTAAAGEGIIARNENRPIRGGMIGAVRNLEISLFPRVGDRLITEVTVTAQVSGIVRVSGMIHRGDSLVARCELTLLLAD